MTTKHSSKLIPHKSHAYHAALLSMARLSERLSGSLYGKLARLKQHLLAMLFFLCGVLLTLVLIHG